MPDAEEPGLKDKLELAQAVSEGYRALSQELNEDVLEYDEATDQIAFAFEEEDIEVMTDGQVEALQRLFNHSLAVRKRRRTGKK